MKRWVAVGICSLALGCGTARYPGEPSFHPAAVQQAPQKADQKLVDAVFEGTGYSSETTRQQLFAQKVRERLVRQDYAGLEKIAAAVEKSPPPRLGDSTADAIFYEALADGPEYPGGWAGCGYRLREWMRQNPRSVTARRGYIRMLGCEFERSRLDNSFNDWDLAAPDPIDKANELLGEIEGGDPLAGLLCLLWAPNSEPQAEKLYQEARTAHPGSVDPYLARLRYLNQQGQSLTPFAQALENDPESYALALLAWHQLFSPARDPFRAGAFKYPKLLPALRSLQAKEPDSLYLSSVIAWAAQLNHDETTLKAELARLGRTQDPVPYPDGAAFTKLRAEQGLASPEGSAPSVVPAGFEASLFGPANHLGDVGYQAVVLLKQRRFLELEALASRYRGDVRELRSFYASLGELGMQTDELRKRRQAELEAWLAERPDSVDVQMALASYWLEIGWLARGGGYANTVSESAHATFQDCLKKADAALDKAEKLGCKDMALPLARLAVGQGQGDTDGMERAFEAARKVDPKSVLPSRSMVIPLLPRWYGSLEALRTLSKDAVTTTRAQLGEGAAAVVGLEAMEYEGDEVEFFWPGIVRGMADLEKRQLADDDLRNRYAQEAVRRKDRAAARAAFAHLSEKNYAPNLWLTLDHFQKARAWADGGENWPEVRPEFYADNGRVYDSGRWTNGNRVPLKKGNGMALELSVTGIYAFPVHVYEGWSHPPMSDPKSDEPQTSTWLFPDTGSKHTFAPQWTFEADYELVPGKFAYEVVDENGDPLTRYEFEAVREP